MVKISGTMKEKIFEAAAKLFAKNGYADTSIQDLAREVGIKSSSIYYHYECKEDILNDIIECYVERMECFHDHMEHLVDNLEIRQDNLEELVNSMVYRYTPEEYELMRNVSKVVFREQFRSFTAGDVLYGSGYQRTYQSYLHILERICQAGFLSEENLELYADICVRISISYLPQFIHPELVEDIDTMDRLYAFLIKVIHGYETAKKDRQ